MGVTMASVVRECSERLAVSREQLRRIDEAIEAGRDDLGDTRHMVLQFLQFDKAALATAQRLARGE